MDIHWLLLLDVYHQCRIVKMGRENEALAKHNFEISLNKFKIVTVPTIEFRSAQENYINPLARFRLKFPKKHLTGDRRKY